MFSFGACAVVVAATPAPQDAPVSTNWLAVAAIALPLLVKLGVELKNGQRLMGELCRANESLDRLIEQHRQPFGVSSLELKMNAHARRMVALLRHHDIDDPEAH
ncbi:MAG: hypothetical protein DRQ55_12735 [Planctomycetota bacterium]|nr:MAG: hypothetical protein DRQ55_12735 [Planctomycetota bacterium]